MMLPSDALCFCGTLEEATAKGRDLYIQMVASDCPVWAFQIAVILVRYATLELKREPNPLNSEEVKMATTEIDAAFRKFGWTMDDIDAAIRRKKEELHR